MEKNKRWIVTFTKHIRQKRKVYQDGFLEYHCSSNKIVLYDDSGKLLDSRFLKKDDLVECGVTLAFESHFVDICNLDETYKPLKDRKQHDCGEKSTQKAKKYSQTSKSSSLGLEEPISDSPAKKCVISSGASRLIRREKDSMNKQIHRDAFQIISALRRPPQQILVNRSPLMDAACPQYMVSSHSDLQGSVSSSDVPKLVNPNCDEVASKYCKSPLQAPSIISVASDIANNSGGRICIKESCGSLEEDKSIQRNRDFTGFDDIDLRDKLNESKEIFCQLHSDPKNEGFNRLHSLSASSLEYVSSFPSINANEKTPGFRSSPEVTKAEDYPSFDLGFEL